MGGKTHASFVCVLALLLDFLEGLNITTLDFGQPVDPLAFYFGYFVLYRRDESTDS